MATLDEIKQKYSEDSKGAFGNVKNPFEKKKLRENSKKAEDEDWKTISAFTNALGNLRWELNIKSPSMRKALNDLNASYKRFRVAARSAAALKGYKID